MLDPIKQDLSSIKQDVSGLKQDMTEVKARVTKIELVQENKTNKNIQLLFEVVRYQHQVPAS